MDIGLIAEAVKGGGSWISTSPSTTHSVDIEICEDQPIVGNTIIHFKCFVWESWDAKGNNVKITGRYWASLILGKVTKTMLETKTETIVDTPVELLIHIIKRDKDTNMEDKTLCGKLWDHPVITAKNICEECKKIAEQKGYKWRAT